MPTIADLLGIVDRFKRNPWESAQDYARGVARSIPEAGASIIDALPRRPGMGSTTDWLNQRLLGTPLEAKGTNTEGAGGLLGFPGAGTALKGGAAALGKLGGLLGAGIMTYHGTPHKFDKFDLSKIGTGEGAQAYGHGLYFAENPKTAAFYKTALTPPRLAEAQQINELLPVQHRGTADNAYRVLTDIQDAMTRGDIKSAKDYLKTFDVSKELQPAYEKAQQIVSSKGAIYKQDLPDEVLPKMLQWDKPLSEQPAAVRESLHKAWLAHKDDNAKMTGAQIWNAQVGPMGATPNDVAEMFKRAGIPGVSYFDQGSRGAGMGTMNHVVWDQALLDLMRPQRVE